MTGKHMEVALSLEAVLGVPGSDAGTLPALQQLLALPWKQKASSDSKGCPSRIVLKTQGSKA